MCGRQAQPRAHHLFWLPREIPLTLTAAQFGADCFADLLPLPAVHTQAIGRDTRKWLGRVLRAQKIYPRTASVPLSVGTCGYAKKTSTAIAIFAVTRPSRRMFPFFVKFVSDWHELVMSYFPAVTP
jgi:hypothetical protein